MYIAISFHRQRWTGLSIIIARAVVYFALIVASVGHLHVSDLQAREPSGLLDGESGAGIQADAILEPRHHQLRVQRIPSGRYGRIAAQ